MVKVKKVKIKDLQAAYREAKSAFQVASWTLMDAVVKAADYSVDDLVEVNVRSDSWDRFASGEWREAKIKLVYAPEGSTIASYTVVLKNKGQKKGTPPLYSIRRYNIPATHIRPLSS